MEGRSVQSVGPVFEAVQAVPARSSFRSGSLDAVCAGNRLYLGGTGNEAFRAGTLSAEGLVRLLAVTLPYWRPARNRPHKGHLFVRTLRGGQRLTHRNLAAFYAVEADGPDQRSVSARTIQRLLQVVGAAYHAARGDGVKVEAMLLSLLGKEGSTTPAGLLSTAKKTAPWAACLCTDSSAEARRRRLLARFRTSFDDGIWSRSHLEDLMAEISRATDEQDHPPGSGAVVPLRSVVASISSR